MTRTLIFCLFFIASSVWANVEKINSVRQFTFNHSLWDHSPSIKTNTGYWVGEFAAKNKTKYAWNGQFGFMDYTKLPPWPQLSSPNSRNAWVPKSRKFGKLNLDSIVIMPPNFVWDWEKPIKRIEYAHRVLDYVAKDHPDIIYYIYEHWPKAEASFLDAKQWQGFKSVTRGGFHQWFLDYQNGIIASRPQLNVRMIPVGPVMMDILDDKGLKASSLKWEDMFKDQGPHGKVETYFLAGLITYQVLFGQKASSQYKPPTSINTLIRDDFPVLNDFVWQRLQHYNNNGVKIWP